MFFDPEILKKCPGLIAALEEADLLDALHNPEDPMFDEMPDTDEPWRVRHPFTVTEE